uniref:Uncharacterized protein n=1 Tax=Caenorhabditis tropicalis TaxID=1561998 RepID=A0A1I7TJB8_9PELO
MWCKMLNETIIYANLWPAIERLTKQWRASFSKRALGSMRQEANGKGVICMRQWHDAWNLCFSVTGVKNNQN